MDLFEFETDVGDGGDVPAPAEPDTETAPEPQPEPEAWSGPTQEEWQQTQAQLQQASELFQILQAQQQGYQPEYEEPQQLPDYDPYDPESQKAYFDAKFDQLARSQQQAVAPIQEQYANQQASEWAEQTFSQLGVPEDELWRNGVLFASAGFQSDPYGNPVHPSIAARNGFDFLRQFADAERQAAVEEYKKTQEAEAAALRERVGSPDLPSGPAGGEGAREWASLEEATQAWREREQAALSG